MSVNREQPNSSDSAIAGAAIVMAWGSVAIKWVGIILLYLVVYWTMAPMIDRWVQLATVGRIQ